MNMKLILIFLSIIVILAGIPTSLALPQYLASLTKVYGDGSCNTCHTGATSDGPRTSYGMLFENQPDHTTNASAALIAIGAPPAANPPTATPEVTATITATPAAPAGTSNGTPKSPGFGIVLSLMGLFAWSLLTKRNNK